MASGKVLDLYFLSALIDVVLLTLTYMLLEIRVKTVIHVAD